MSEANDVHTGGARWGDGMYFRTADLNSLLIWRTMSRTSKPASRSPRRQFIGELAAGAAALAATACSPTGAATNTPSQAPKPATPPAQTEMPTGPLPVPPKEWDSSWMSRITAKHKAIFDSPEINEGTALYHAMSYLGSVKDVFGTGDSDASVVVVLRHRAVPLLFNDAMWAKYDLGTATKTNDSKTGKPVMRNIYFQHVNAHGNPAVDDKPSATIKSLSARGVIFVGCDMATRGFASRAAAATKQPSQQVYEDIKANLIPGATLMPTGVFATLMAQEAGCSLMRST